MTTAHAAPAPARGLRQLVPGIVIGLLIAGGLLLGQTRGWRAHDIVTGSLGTAAPVGSLVITRPASTADLRVGQVIVFHPPGLPHETFVHRVVAVRGPEGAQLLTTKGDLSGSTDPWVLPAHEVLGSRVAIIPAAGWLLRMAGWLLLGTLAVLLATQGLLTERRRTLRILGLVVVVVICLFHFRPLVGMELVSYGPTAHGGAQASAVPTGLLPIRVAATHGAAGVAHADPGQLFTVNSDAFHGRLKILARPWLHGLWWLLLLTWLLPLAAGLRTVREPVPAA